MCANYFLVKNGNKVIKNYNFKKHIGSYWFSQGFYFLLWPNLFLYCFFISVQFSCWVMFISLWPHGLQYARLICPSPTPKACPNSCLSSWWRHPTISFSAVPFSSRLQSFPASGSFPMSQYFASSGQSIGASASASVLPKNIQDWFSLELLVWTPYSPRDYPASSPTPQFKSINSSVPSLWSNTHIHTRLLEKP